jgi:hypothetical protein
MVQRRDDSRFTLEARKPIGISGDERRKIS